MTMYPILRVSNLHLDAGRRPGNVVPLLDGVNLDVYPGEAVGIIGESGSGKSLLVKAIIRLLSENIEVKAGTINVSGISMLDSDESTLRDVRGSIIGMVFQDSIGSLDPLFTVESQIVEAIRRHQDVSKKVAKAKALRLLEAVGINEVAFRLRAYPHELSGGMAQRVAIAIAIANTPQLLIADEATTALDVTIQEQIIGVIKDVQQRNNCSVIFVSHDLATVGSFVDKIAVMYAGRIVEFGSTNDVIYKSRHPYTAALVKSRPILGGSQESLSRLGGTVPIPGQWPEGCRFQPRCKLSRGRELCDISPELSIVDDNHFSACHFANELNPKVIG